MSRDDALDLTRFRTSISRLRYTMTSPKGPGGLVRDEVPTPALTWPCTGWLMARALSN